MLFAVMIMWLISGKAGRNSQSGLHCFVLSHYILHVMLSYICTNFHILIGLTLHPILGVRKPVMKF